MFWVINILFDQHLHFVHTFVSEIGSCNLFELLRNIYNKKSCYLFNAANASAEKRMKTSSIYGNLKDIMPPSANSSSIVSIILRIQLVQSQIWAHNISFIHLQTAAMCVHVYRSTKINKSHTKRSDLRNR